MDGGVLGFRTGGQEEMERSPEHAEGHSDVGELSDGSIQGARLEPPGLNCSAPEHSRLDIGRVHLLPR